MTKVRASAKFCHFTQPSPVTAVGVRQSHETRETGSIEDPGLAVLLTFQLLAVLLTFQLLVVLLTFQDLAVLLTFQDLAVLVTFQLLAVLLTFQLLAVLLTFQLLVVLLTFQDLAVLLTFQDLAVLLTFQLLAVLLTFQDLAVTPEQSQTGTQTGSALGIQLDVFELANFAGFTVRSSRVEAGRSLLGVHSACLQLQ
ncbi:Hypothetical predicted protein [Pelobates cultripes]|uniref:Uncharacterized protein n=1 Tax=Pelobates cultripes TaxID=61616 RepID=A0AAD1T7V4_PELCU|nr:Hypothetical predicted protein [Pelobates cultripes]